MLRFLLFTTLGISSLCLAKEPSVEILGVAVSKGMTETYLRSVLPIVGCIDFPSEDKYKKIKCSVENADQSESEGTILFQNGEVFSASRYFLFPENATPFEVTVILNKTIARLMGDDRAVCTKIQSSPGAIYSPEGKPMPVGTPATIIRSGSTINPATTSFVFPEKVLTITMHTFRGQSVVMTESLRQNPVPKSYKVRGDKLRGDEWCGYVN